MAQSRLSIGVLAVLALLCAGPAVAQFGSIFREEPPRPPADVPSQQPSQQPIQQPSRQPTQPLSNFPSRQPGNLPGRNEPRPPADLRSDVPPAQPLPAPMSLPPGSRPGAGAIQSQPLPPPPGVPVAPQPPANELPQQGTLRPGPGTTLPGLPPGVRQPPGTPALANTAPQPGDEVVVEPPPQRIANPTAVFAGLDKITGRIISFDVAINETVQFGALQVTPRVCYSRPPTETPNTDAFVEVDEVTLQGEIKRIFTGWMFAASPGLHAVEHPVYDVWITDCKGGRNPAVADVADEPPPAAKQPARTPPPRSRAQPRAQPPGLLPAIR